MNQVLAYSAYKQFLRDYLDSKRKVGIRGRLARAAGIQPAYLSQVLNGKVHLTPEHALGVAQFLEFSQSETSYFTLLVDLDRASSPQLRKRITENIENLRKNSKLALRRTAADYIMKKVVESIYFSDWIFAAINVLVTIPRFQTREAILEKLKSNCQRGNYAIDFLIRNRIIFLDQGKLTVKRKSIVLSPRSPFVGRHHLNHRLLAGQRALEGDPADFQYSATLSISESKAMEFRDRLLLVIEEMRTEIRDSKEEELYCFNVDLIRPLS